MHDRLYGTSIPLAVMDYSAPQTEEGKYTTGCKRPVHHRLLGMSAPKVVRDGCTTGCMGRVHHRLYGTSAPQTAGDEHTTDYNRMSIPQDVCDQHITGCKDVCTKGCKGPVHHRL